MTKSFNDDINESLRTSQYANTVEGDGYLDRDGQFPLPEYRNQSSTNKATRGGKPNKVYMGGGDITVDLGLKPAAPSRHPKNQVKKTVTGHIIEIDDTPENPRMLFRHRTGAGVQMNADGSIVISSVENTVRITGGDEKVIIEGDGEVSYNGNLTMNVTGDFDLKVGGNFNVVTSGDKNEETRGARREIVEKNFEQKVKQNRSEYTLGVHTETVLSDKNTITKGSVRDIIEGDIERLGGGKLIMTAQNIITMSSPNINVGAKSLTVIGDSGTIGGENIIGYDYNHYTGHSLTATDTISTNTAIVSQRTTSPEFVGSLTGNADTATQAGRAGTAGALGAGGSAGSKVTGTPTAVDTTATRLPNLSRMNAYLHVSDLGVRQVDIDPGEVMKNQIDRSVTNGGIATRKLSTAEVRSKMRDPITSSNKQFVGTQIAEGKLSSTYIQSIPPAIGRTVKKGSEPRRSETPIGNTLNRRRFEG